MITQTADKSKRIEYIDIIKGFSILWVVAFHTRLNSSEDLWIFVQYRMPLFFFLSGIFFRKRQLKEFVKKRINTLLIPFCVFWIVGLLVAVVKYEILAPFVDFEFKGMGSFSDYATSLIGLFCLRPEPDTCVVNGALWFLLALFVIQIFHYLCVSLTEKKYIFILVAILLYVASWFLEKYEITGLFYLSGVCQYYIYYMTGSLFGSTLMKFVEKGIYRLTIFLCCMSFLIILPLLDLETNVIIDNIAFNIRIFCFIAIIFVFFRKTCKLKLFTPLKFFGQHSLEVLVTHALVLILIRSIMKHYLQLSSDISIEHAWKYMVIIFIICMILEYYIIKILNRYVPQFIGKQNLIA
jgi:fucose 4-O-acetylase-like acetyltransferase